MIKLVLHYTVGDDCTWSADLDLPFEYESKEKAEYDLLVAAEEGLRESAWEINFEGHSIDPSYLFYRDQKGKLTYIEPQILTLEEWFDAYKMM